jgi:hypothetical protein
LLPAAAIFWRKTVPSVPVAARQPWHIYLTLWSLTPCIFFTFAGNILWTYVLPALPALAILIAGWLSRHVTAHRVNRVLIGGLFLMAAVFSVFIINIKLAPAGDVKTTKALIQEYKIRKIDNEPLIFLEKRPQSAAFYSGGKAEQLPDADVLNRRLALGSAYVAIKTDTPLTSLPADLQKNLKPVAVHGDYSLYFGKLQK